MLHLALIKADGDRRWRGRLASRLEYVAKVRALNMRAADNWLDRLDPSTWRTRKADIRNVIDYACARTIDYVGSLGDGACLTVSGVNDDFFNGTSAAYPIPFRNIMIATFMLEALRDASELQETLAGLKLDWPNAMVLVSSQ